MSSFFRTYCTIPTKFAGRGRLDPQRRCSTFCLFITVERSGEIGKTCTSIQSWADTLKAHHIVKT